MNNKVRKMVLVPLAVVGVVTIVVSCSLFAMAALPEFIDYS